MLTASATPCCASGGCVHSELALLLEKGNRASLCVLISGSYHAYFHQMLLDTMPVVASSLEGVFASGAAVSNIAWTGHQPIRASQATFKHVTTGVYSLAQHSGNSHID
jgi:hypothetical protein